MAKGAHDNGLKIEVFRLKYGHAKSLEGNTCQRT
jgi:hypothetical protein